MISKNGRRRIYTDELNISEKNVRQIVLDALVKHEANAIDIKELFDIEKNIQTLSRPKEIRSEINVQATDPIGSQIVEFKLGYEHGTPINYKQRANIDSTNKKGDSKEVEKDDLRIATLNEMMRECKKASKDSQLAKNIKTCGVGYRYIIPTKSNSKISPYEIYILNPLRTFVIYSNDVFCEPKIAVTYTVNSTTQNKTFSAWTKDFLYEFDSNEDSKVVKKSANIIGRIPIVEYINNYDIMGSFEKEIPLIDAYNIVTSDRVNDICQQVQSILWLHNTKLDSEQKETLADGGVIQTESNRDGSDAKIQYVNAPLRQADVQTLATDLKERILESAGVPKLSEGQNATGEAMRVTNGWHTAETQAKTSELTWRESEDETLEVCLAIISNSGKNINGVADLKLSDIDYDMHRSENYDIVSRVNALVTLTNAGYDIEKSVALCKVTDDALQFAIDSKENVDRVRFGNKASVSSTNEEKAENEQNTTPENKAVESIQPSTVKI